jgi:hypothetical protein
MLAQRLHSPRPCKNEAQSASRAVTLAETIEHVDNLKRCLQWLINQGICVNSVLMDREKSLPHINVSASPWLHILFRNDCADIGQRQEGNLKIVPWIAVRHGCLIRWEEVAA